MPRSESSKTLIESQALWIARKAEPSSSPGLKIPERLRVNNFDILRLVFASMVFIFHLGILTQEPLLAWMREWVSGTFGLQAFFVVSGFLVTMSYDRSRSIISYLRKRANRIAPAYIAVVLLCAVLLVFLSQLSWSSYFASKGWNTYLFWNLLLANFMAPSLPGVFEEHYKQAVNGSLWTIKIEVAFYCFVPIAAWLSKHLGVWKVLAALFIAALAWRIGFDILGNATGNGFWSKLAIQAPGQFSFFVIGAIAYHRTRLSLSPPPFWMALVGIAAYALTDGYAHMLVAPIAVGVFVYWAAVAAPYLGQASKYGDFSYGVYLYHWPIIQIFVALGLFTTSPVLSTLAVITTVLGLAVISWYVLESRFLKHRKAVAVTPTHGPQTHRD